MADVGLLKRAAYTVVGVVLGAFVSFLSFWADRSSRDPQEMLGIKTITRGATANVQSMVFGAVVVVVPALILASVVALVVRRRTA